MTQFPLCISSSIIFLMGAVKLMGTYIYGGKSNATIRNAIRKYKVSKIVVITIIFYLFIF